MFTKIPKVSTELITSEFSVVNAEIAVINQTIVNKIVKMLVEPGEIIDVTLPAQVIIKADKALLVARPPQIPVVVIPIVNMIKEIVAMALKFIRMAILGSHIVASLVLKIVIVLKIVLMERLILSQVTGVMALTMVKCPAV